MNAAKDLNKSNLKFALANNKAMLQKYKINFEPTVKFIRNDKVVDYEEEITKKGIINWWNIYATKYKNETLVQYYTPAEGKNTRYIEDNGIMLLNEDNFEEAKRDFNELVVKVCKYFKLFVTVPFIFKLYKRENNAVW